MKTAIFTGSGTALVTPFCKDDILKIDYKKAEELIDFQINNGTSALIINGTTGENATQPVTEHADFVDHCVKYVNGRCKVVSGVGSNDTHTSLFLAERAKKAGVDGILMVTPYYNKASQTGLLKHFGYVADRVDVPMILYNVPSRTNVTISPQTCKTLSEHPNINGIKEASGDFGLLSNIISLCGDDLNVWSGNDDCVVPLMSLGGKGVISVASNIVPAVMAKICSLCLEGDFKAASELQFKHMDLFNKLFIEVNPMPAKAALNLMGMDVGEPRLPLCELAPPNQEKLRKTLDSYGLIK